MIKSWCWLIHPERAIIMNRTGLSTLAMSSVHYRQTSDVRPRCDQNQPDPVFGPYGVRKDIFSAQSQSGQYRHEFSARIHRVNSFIGQASPALAPASYLAR